MDFMSSVPIPAQKARIRKISKGPDPKNLFLIKKEKTLLYEYTMFYSCMMYNKYYFLLLCSTYNFKHLKKVK